jgi:hypothetical protein
MPRPASGLLWALWHSAVYDHTKFQFQGGKTGRVPGNCDGMRTFTLDDANPHLHAH